MEFRFECHVEQPTLIKHYFHQLDLPRGFTTAVKFQGQILLNGQAVSVRKSVTKGDVLTLIAPDEQGHDTVSPSFTPIDIVYEDRDVLVVNKPVDVVSIPSIKAPDTSMANRIKGYYCQKGYADQVIHIVTRLDRDTSGLMLIAKHRLAHALLDRQIQERKILKYYLALSTKRDWPDHGIIDAPIARCDSSLITRKVDPSGKPAKTEFWHLESYSQASLLKLQLHTGRTHQIRVHLSHMKGPLIGDDLYGGPLYPDLQRQALHCSQLIFDQPFTGEKIDIRLDLADDMQAWIKSQVQF